MTAEELHSKLMADARILAIQRLLNVILAEHMGCSREVADARFQEEWDRCFEKILADCPISPESSLRDECKHLHQQEKHRWLNPE